MFSELCNAEAYLQTLRIIAMNSGVDPLNEAFPGNKRSYFCVAKQSLIQINHHFQSDHESQDINIVNHA